jgi:hypothetical protein
VPKLVSVDGKEVHAMTKKQFKRMEMNRVKLEEKVKELKKENAALKKGAKDIEVDRVELMCAVALLQSLGASGNMVPEILAITARLFKGKVTEDDLISVTTAIEYARVIGAVLLQVRENEIITRFIFSYYLNSGPLRRLGMGNSLSSLARTLQVEAVLSGPLWYPIALRTTMASQFFTSTPLNALKGQLQPFSARVSSKW